MDYSGSTLRGCVNKLELAVGGAVAAVKQILRAPWPCASNDRMSGTLTISYHLRDRLVDLARHSVQKPQVHQQRGADHDCEDGQ